MVRFRRRRAWGGYFTTHYEPPRRARVRMIPRRPLTENQRVVLFGLECCAVVGIFILVSYIFSL